MKWRFSFLFSLGCFTLNQGICLTSAIAQDIPNGPSGRIEVNGNNIEINNGDIIPSSTVENGGTVIISPVNIEFVSNPSAAASVTSFQNTLSVNTIDVFSSSLSPTFRIPSDTEIPMNLFEPKQTFAPICLSEQSINKPSGLIIKDQEWSRQEIAPIKISIGDIYPARGVVKTDNGQVILTRYPTDKNSLRTSDIFSCN